MVDCWFTQGDCPGLGASAPSWRVGQTRFYRQFSKIPTMPYDFSQDSHDFFQRWEKMRDFWGKRGVIFLFSLLFYFLFLFLFTFSQEMPDFSQNHGFFREVVGKGLFCLVFRSTFAASKKQDNAEMVW